MIDSFGRNIDYMRISITDRCNLRCRYCMPDGGEWLPMEDILSYEEIGRVCRAAARLGIRHLKITGGEPLVRKGCPELIGSLKNIPGIEAVTITTNGILLEQHLDRLKLAGVDGINVSLDTLDRRQFADLTGFDRLDQVLSGIRRAVDAGFKVKVNAVSLKLDRDKDGSYGWERLAGLAREYPLDVRFIEMMPIGYGKQFETVDHQKLLEQMRQVFPDMEMDTAKHGFGPAVYYRVPGFQGSLGLISAIHGKFCGQCNRVRLTSTGYLKTCLCYEDGVDLRPVLRVADTGAEDGTESGCQELCRVMEQTIYGKPGAHCFEEPERITEGHNMSSIGG